MQYPQWQKTWRKCPLLLEVYSLAGSETSGQNMFFVLPANCIFLLNVRWVESVLLQSAFGWFAQFANICTLESIISAAQLVDFAHCLQTPDIFSSTFIRSFCRLLWCICLQIWDISGASVQRGAGLWVQLASEWETLQEGEKWGNVAPCQHKWYCIFQYWVLGKCRFK